MTHFCYIQEQGKLMYGNKNDKAIASGKGIDGKRLREFSGVIEILCILLYLESNWHIQL